MSSKSEEKWPTILLFFFKICSKLNIHLASGDPISSCGTEIRVNKSSSQDFGEGVDKKIY